MPRDREAVCGGCSILSGMNFVLFPRLGRHVGGGGVTWNSDYFSVIMICRVFRPVWSRCSKRVD